LVGAKGDSAFRRPNLLDSGDTLVFSVRRGVLSMNEVMPLAKVGEAFDRMMSGKGRFRVVLTAG
jgi:D-arabinose 1-dehydrogenase-like Zn-dependent alcohol dehydrogenase